MSKETDGNNFEEQVNSISKELHKLSFWILKSGKLYIMTNAEAKEKVDELLKQHDIDLSRIEFKITSFSSVEI